MRLGDVNESWLVVAPSAWRPWYATLVFVEHDPLLAGQVLVRLLTGLVQRRIRRRVVRVLVLLPSASYTVVFSANRGSASSSGRRFSSSVAATTTAPEPPTAGSASAAVTSPAAVAAAASRAMLDMRVRGCELDMAAMTAQPPRYCPRLI
ncbi:hypothetical protein ACFLIM_27750 [Nonomuraea sp. M3C6]|uniref:Uncharacterized protein n=1 Tax=Nonomuraea marmarensis TaxID=3351344 RepID=A0ABW7AIQ1_9ACTN